MNQNDLKERLDALQASLMTLYETGPKDLKSQIKHFELLRKESALEYYARKEGYTSLGLQHLPTLQVSEHNAKTAIRMSLILQSLAKSQYANEQWTLADTSADRFDSPPRNCFKKDSYEVEVWFDGNPKNAFPYINWRWIYYQDDKDEWHKTAGETDYNGLYFTERDGTKTYFILFSSDADRYGNSGIWTVNVNNEQIFPSVASSSRRSSPVSPKTLGDTDRRSSSPTTYTKTPQKDGGRSIQQEEASTSSATRTSGRRRRRRGEGEPTTSKRRRRGERHILSAEEVGSSHRSVPRSGLSRIERLEEEARDPPILVVKGPANPLKCWRYRCDKKYKSFYLCMTTVFRWVSNEVDLADGRVLVAFANSNQRSRFIDTVPLPKGTSMCMGNLECL
ncbi:regulatory protein [Human papillomavirus 140]|uniref:Regulatory protein E2 n=1 Tax=Human papillomavirus 140 TaxID=1070413 RepID=I3P6M7_9PAPI|nr:regulatory protein [Human papillomavirus 140]AEM24631.1 regulatory protein [Human papillomavirus 140]